MELELLPVFIPFILVCASNWRKVRKEPMGYILRHFCSQIVPKKRWQPWRTGILDYERKLSGFLPSQSQSVQQCSRNSKWETAVQLYRRKLLLFLKLLFNYFRPTLLHSFLSKRYCRKVEVILRSCVIKLRHRNRCWLLSIVYWLINLLMFRNMLQIFVDLCHNILPSRLLILSQDFQGNFVVFWRPPPRIYGLVTEDSTAQSLRHELLLNISSEL